MFNACLCESCLYVIILLLFFFFAFEKLFSEKIEIIFNMLFMETEYIYIKG